MNNILQGIILLIISVLLLFFRLKYPSPSPDSGASDQNLEMAILGFFILGISIITGLMPPISFF
jgi:hypothetical protein